MCVQASYGLYAAIVVAERKMVMEKETENDVHTQNTSGALDNMEGIHRQHAQQGDLTGDGVSITPGKAGRDEAIEDAANQIAAKKAANK
jgi:hypothetical protein